MDEKRNPLCTKTSCHYWQYKRKENIADANALCERCGFSYAENERRKRIPLTLCDDGLRRKLIPPRGKTQETEVEDDTGGNDDSGIEEEGDGIGDAEPGT